MLLGAALLGIVVVSALAVRESMHNARERKEAAERTVRDYARFASYLYTTRAYLFARERAAARRALEAQRAAPGVSSGRDSRHDGGVWSTR